MANGERTRPPTSNSNRYVNLRVPKDFLEKVKKWTSFYRKYPFVFVEDTMNIKLKTFQKLQLYILNNYNFSTILASRGLGKSFITSIYVHTRCVLYPNTQVVIAAGVKSQAMELVTYIDRFRKNSDAVDKEISYLSDGKTDPKIDYWNGSTIRVVASNDNARGKRAHVLILDEYRIIPLEIVTMVLRKFRSSTRQCGFLNKPEYAHLKERNKEIYLSSTYYKHSWAYKHFLSFLEMMKKGGSSHFTCCLPYQLAVMEGIKNLEELQEEYDEGVDEQLWKMEYETWWIGSDDEMSFFKFDNIDPCRKLVKPLYPREVLETMEANDKFFNDQFKKTGEIRLLFADIARKVSTTGENDATAVGVMCLSPVEDKRLGTTYFLREIRYLETFTGQNTLVQSLRIRKLFEWFDCDYLVIDAQNIGASIIDNLSLPMTDPETGQEFTPINAINHDALKLGTVLYPSAPKRIYGVMGSPALNSDIGYSMRDTLSKRRIRFLVDEANCRRELATIKSYDTLSPETKGILQQPYLQTTALINEMIELEYKISPDTNLLRLNEKTGNRKDRYSACSYANYYADILEKDLFKPQDKFAGLEDFVGFYQF